MREWIFFGGLFLFILILEIYSFQVVKTLTKSWKWALAVNAFSIALLVFIFILSQSIERGSRDPNVTQKLFWITGIFVAFIVPKIFLIIPLILEDIYRLFAIGHHAITQQKPLVPARRKVIAALAIGTAAVPFLGIIYGVFRGKYNYRVIKQTLYFDDLPTEFDGFTFVQISDLHCGSWGNPDRIKEGIELINEQKAEAVFFTGDLVNAESRELLKWKNLIGEIQAPMGVFSVLGNHDYGYINFKDEKEYQDNLHLLLDTQKAMGFDVLLNEHRTLKKNGEHIHLIGVENWGAAAHFPKRGNLTMATEGVENESFKILLSHDPTHFDFKDFQVHNDGRKTREANLNEIPVKDFSKKIQLTLSGHTHGAQFGIEIPGILKWSPVKYFYKKWAGLYEENNRYLYVNRGFGFLAFPGRVGIWPEITHFILKKKT